MTNIKCKEVSKIPGLYAGDILIASWDKLVETRMVIIKDSILTRCYLEDPGDLVIPEGIKEIGDGCFKGCSNLYSVTLPSSIEEVGFGAFHDCVDMECISVIDISKISSIAFRK